MIKCMGFAREVQKLCFGFGLFWEYQREKKRGATSCVVLGSVKERWLLEDSSQGLWATL